MYIFFQEQTFNIPYCHIKIANCQYGLVASQLVFPLSHYVTPTCCWPEPPGASAAPRHLAPAGGPPGYLPEPSDYGAPPSARGWRPRTWRGAGRGASAADWAG